MKKIGSLLIGMLLIICLITTTFAETTTTSFDITLVKSLVSTGFYTSVDTIMDTVEDRSAISCALLIDLATQKPNLSDFTFDNFADCIMNNSVILTDGNFIGVNGFFDHKVVHISYDPSQKIANYYIENAGSGSDDFNCEFYKTQMEKAGFTVYINESDEMYRVAGILLNMGN